MLFYGNKGTFLHVPEQIKALGGIKQTVLNTLSIIDVISRY